MDPAGISLPVKLEYFTIQQSAPGVLELNWKTAEQFTNLVYELQRASGNYEFKTIAYLMPPDNSTTPREYRYRDAVNDWRNTKLVFYRVKQVQNNKVSYSDVKSYRLSGTQSDIMLNLLPNPATTAIQLNLYTEKTAAMDIAVTDISGRRVLVKTITAISGNNTITLNEIGSMEKGIYFINVLLNGSMIGSKKFLKL